MSEIFASKAFLLVTGASRGIGKAIAETFASNLRDDSMILLVARNLKNLEIIANTMPKGLVVSCKSIDFGNTTTEELEEALRDALRKEGKKPESFDQAIIVHCAAAIDYSRAANDLINFNDWHKFFDVNFFSSAVLNGIFMKTFDERRIKKYVVNVSSYWGLKPDANVSSFCAARAAKDMFFKALALENSDVNVLNYLPGYVKTDMFNDALEQTNNKELVVRIKSAIDNDTVVTPETTAECLVNILKGQKYQSGDYVDFKKLKN